MLEKSAQRRMISIQVWAVFISLLLFWVVLYLPIHAGISRHFHMYSLWMFLIILSAYILSFRLPGQIGLLVCFSLTMTLFALPLSYKWTSGFSDNMLIGGLLPYKDAKNYYLGANLILDGLPMIRAGQATERPLFPGFLATILTLTGQNLKITLAIIAQLAGVAFYGSARQIHKSFGALPAGLYATLMVIYIQPMLGYALSEALGFLAGCLGFSALWMFSHNGKWTDLLCGIAVLMVAISARAGAFFIFPMLALWAGWILRGEERFSLKTMAIVLSLMYVGYFLVNSLYARVLGIPPGSTFGNLSYALYGQARGGTGWYSAIEELGTRNSEVVYRATLDYFLEHPVSLIIGFAKSYRDFFLFGDRSIFPFFGQSQMWQIWLPWLGTIFLLLVGLIGSFRNLRSHSAALLVAGFFGIFLSIPFLPPIDGGARFHAGTMPFFFSLPAVGIGYLVQKLWPSQSIDDANIERHLSRVGVSTLLFLVMVVPPFIRAFEQSPEHGQPACPADQEAFVLEFHPGSYLDLILDGASACDAVPQVCLSEFEKNNLELKTDDFYQTLITLTKQEDVNYRIIPATDQLTDTFHYFYMPHASLPKNPVSNLLTGCAIEIKTRNQSIYQVESILP